MNPGLEVGSWTNFVKVGLHLNIFLNAQIKLRLKKLVLSGFYICVYNTFAAVKALLVIVVPAVVVVDF